MTAAVIAAVGAAGAGVADDWTGVVSRDRPERVLAATGAVDAIAGLGADGTAIGTRNFQYGRCAWMVA